MLSKENTQEVEQTLDVVLKRIEVAVADKDLQKLVESVVASLKDSHITNTIVFEHLTSLAVYIAEAKKEIAAIRAEADQGAYIPTATDHLDAVVGATEAATNKIMDSCDAITSIAGTLPELSQAALMEQVTKMYEACNFQDITGQRITRVVRTLKHIEAQVETLLNALEKAGFQLEQLAKHSTKNHSHATDSEKHLLNGPQLGDDGVKQDDIDKLFG